MERRGQNTTLPTNGRGDIVSIPENRMTSKQERDPSFQQLWEEFYHVPSREWLEGQIRAGMEYAVRIVYPEIIGDLTPAQRLDSEILSKAVQMMMELLSTHLRQNWVAHLEAEEYLNNRQSWEVHQGED